MNVKKIIASFVVVVSMAQLNAEELLRTEQTWEGADIEYPTGTPEVTSIKLNIAEGELTPFHCHPVPTVGYVLQGDLEVETKDGKKKMLHKGESVVEVLRTVHRGRAVGGPVEIVVFYIGVTSMPHTVLPENDPDHEYCDG
ncbi:cupin domain-containing protein [Pseudomonadales bacterium]|jgi:quercetin dioxygenase-like cupin family protein|nr:cupin domain-containing protein [Pseudomonadales bacterium]MDA8965755.1 cupin domain-containing protein [Pseudomonadales bacterium]MDB4421081.1 cupin domain-containing protein [Pseudomonadales bacterium]MDB4542140.1 cupin domain-containing protein [Pseudomonadales bacterium]MDB4825247.1 cupin domain-containing protein [Pseudomonadales bacterium]